MFDLEDTRNNGASRTTFSGRFKTAREKDIHIVLGHSFDIVAELNQYFDEDRAALRLLGKRLLPTIERLCDGLVEVVAGRFQIAHFDRRIRKPVVVLHPFIDGSSPERNLPVRLSAEAKSC